MSPREVSEPLIRDAQALRATDTVVEAATALVETDLPALPVVDARDRLVGIFGEREFLGAVFPGYLKELKHAGFVRRSLDDALEKREQCRTEQVAQHMNTEHVHVGPGLLRPQRGRDLPPPPRPPRPRHRPGAPRRRDHPRRLLPLGRAAVPREGRRIVTVVRLPDGPVRDEDGRHGWRDVVILWVLLIALVLIVVL